MSKWDDAKLIKESYFGEWAMYEKDNSYAFRQTDEDGEWAHTPYGALLTTGYRKIADKLLDDLDSFGSDYRGGDSALPWQYTIIDHFSKLSHKEVEKVLDDSFLKKKDWTLDSGLETNPTARELFGIRADKKAAIRNWLSKCSHLQMTAACCIGNACYSLNVAYTIAELMEKYDGEQYREKLNTLADIVATCIQDTPFNIKAIFSVFELYYSIHLETNGKLTK